MLQLNHAKIKLLIAAGLLTLCVGCEYGQSSAMTEAIVSKVESIDPMAGVPEPTATQKAMANCRGMWVHDGEKSYCSRLKPATADGPRTADGPAGN